MRRDLRLHRGAAGRIEEHQRNGRHRRLFTGRTGGNRGVTDERAAAAVGMAQPPAERIEHPPRHGFARLAQRDHDPEGRLARGEIVGPVDRVDDPAQRIAQPVEPGRIGVGRFLADNRRIGQQPGQPFGQDQFGFAVGNRHHVVRRLGVDFVGGKRLVARQHGLRRCLLHHRQDPGGQRPGQER